MAWVQYAQSVGDGMQNFWYNDETGETSFDDLPPSMVKQIWDQTPGGIDQKLAAVAAQGPGNAGAIDLAAKAGLASPEQLQNSGVGISVQQASADKSSPFSDLGKLALGSVGFGVGGATGAAALTGNDLKTAAGIDLAGLAAAPLAAGGLAALTPAAAAAGEAAGTLGAVPMGAATTAATGTGAAMATGAALPAAAGGTLGGLAGAELAGSGATAAPTALPNAGMDLGMYGDFGNPYVLGTSAPDATAATVAATSPAATTGLGAAGTAGAIGGGTALSRILSSDPSNPSTNADVLSVLGTGAATGLGIYGSNQQADALRAIADQSRTDRAPFLNKSLEYLNNPNAYYEGPGKASLDAVLRGLSVKGNPFGNPGSLEIATNAGMRDWRDAVTGFGNIGLSGEDTRANLQSKATGADANVLNAIGSGLADVLAGIPGLGGFQARRAMMEQEDDADIRKAGSLQSILAGQQQMKQKQALQQALVDSGGDVEKAIELAVKTGNVEAAHQLAPLAKLAQEKRQGEQTRAGLAALSGPEAAPAAGPQELGIGQPVQVAGADQAADPRQARVAHLNKLATLYATNPVVVQRIQAEIDKLEASKKPIIEHNFSVGNDMVQPHISHDEGRTWQPIPGSKPSSKFAKQVEGKSEATGLSQEY